MRDVRLRTEKNRLMNRSRREKQPRHGKVYPQSRTFFSRNGKKSLKKSVPPPEKIPDFSDLFPWNGQFYVIQRTKISQKRPFLSQPKDKNFARKANFMPSERQKFPEKGHFLPAKRQKFSENRHFFANRRTENSRKQPFLY